MAAAAALSYDKGQPAPAASSGFSADVAYDVWDIGAAEKLSAAQAALLIAAGAVPKGLRAFHRSWSFGHRIFGSTTAEALIARGLARIADAERKSLRRLVLTPKGARVRAAAIAIGAADLAEALIRERLP